MCLHAQATHQIAHVAQRNSVGRNDDRKADLATPTRSVVDEVIVYKTEAIGEVREVQARIELAVERRTSKLCVRQRAPHRAPEAVDDATARISHGGSRSNVRTKRGPAAHRAGVPTTTHAHLP